MDSLPSSSAGTCSSRSDTYISSGKPSGSSILWAHLLRKDAQQGNSSTEANQLPLPPLAPSDKLGTSTRILLLDTQAHLEKFAKSVEDLTVKVDCAKQEIVTVKTLFEQDREVLLGDFVDKLSRSQSEIQKTVGSPAQANQLEDLRKNVELKLESMDQRLNSMQMLSQTYSQMLQNQARALQSVQDQQSTIIGALTPLLPLLQAVPIHIESARNNLTESLSKSLQSIQLNSLSSNCKKIPSTPAAKRSHTPSSSARKRQRVDENGDETAAHVPLSVAVGISPNHAKNLPGSANRPRNVAAVVRRKQSGLSHPSRPPLAELSLSSNAAGRGSTFSPSTGDAHMRVIGTVDNSNLPAAMGKSIAQFRPEYAPPSTSKTLERSPMDLTANASTVHQNLQFAPSTVTPAMLPSGPHGKLLPAMPEPVMKPVSSVSNLKLTNTNTNSSALAGTTSTPARHRLGPSRVQGATPKAGILPPYPRHQAQATPSSRSAAAPNPANLFPQRLQMPATPRSAAVTLIPPSSPSSMFASTKKPMLPPTVRRRRSPLQREGRRFIPLDDLDSDSSDDERT